MHLYVDFAIPKIRQIVENMIFYILFWWKMPGIDGNLQEVNIMQIPERNPLWLNPTLSHGTTRWYTGIYTK